MPWRATSTPRSIEVWQGSVMLGMTVRALIVLAPLATSRSMLGVRACWSASGRIPSMLKRMTIWEWFYFRLRT